MTVARSFLLWFSIATLGLPRPASASDKPGAIDTPLRDHWLRIETPHLVVFTNADEAVGTAVSRKIERLREVFESLGAPLHREADVPTVVLLFRDSKSFDPYRGKFNGQQRQDAGLFVRTARTNFLVVDASTTIDVALHEYTHLLTSLIIQRPPLWLNEGLAEFYSTFEAKGRIAEIGRPIALYRLQLVHSGILPIQEFRNIAQDDPRYHTGDYRGMIYAESWALVHMLQFGVPDGRAHFSDFIQRLSHGQSEGAAFAAAYPGLDPRSLDDQLRKYLASQMSLPYVELEFSRSFDTIESRVSDARLADVVESLADFLTCHADDDPGALEHHYQAAQGIGSVAAIAMAGLGETADARHDTSAANALYEQALATPADPDLDRSRRIDVAHALMARGPAGALRARQILEPLVQGDGASVDALALEGHSYVVAGGDDQAGIGALMLAQGVAPRRLDIASDMVVLQARSGNLSAAMHVFRALLLGCNRPVVEHPALEALASAQWKQIDQSARNGQPERADSLRLAFPRALEGADLPASVANWPNQLSVVVMNQGIDAGNRGHYDAALQSLDRSLALAESPSLREDIHRMHAHFLILKRLAEVDGLMSRAQWRDAKGLLDQISIETLEPDERKSFDARLREVQKRLGSEHR